MVTIIAAAGALATPSSPVDFDDDWGLDDLGSAVGGGGGCAEEFAAGGDDDWGLGADMGTSTV